MPYLLAIILLILFFIIGEVVTSLLQMTEKKHSILYGFIFYMSFFFVISAACVFINVPWKVYMIAGIAYSVGVIGLTVFYFIKQKLYKKLNLKTLMKASWPAYIVIVAYVTTFLFTLTMEFLYSQGTLPVAIDNHIYMARAMQAIGQDQMLPRGESIVFLYSHEFDMVGLVAYWEFFWGFLSSLFNMNVPTIAHTVIPLIIYPITIFGLDELFYLFSTKLPKKIAKNMKYLIFILLVILCIEGMAMESLKYIFYPWFGNNIVMMIYVPMIIIFLYYALRDIKMLFFLFSLPFIFIAFNPTAIIFSWFFYFLAIICWYNFKEYETKYDKKILIAFSLLIAGLLLVSLYDGRKSHFWLTIPDIFQFANEKNMLEHTIFTQNFAQKQIFTIIAMLTFAYRYYKKQLLSIEGIFMGGVFVLLILTVLPFLYRIPFNLFNFSYTRLMHMCTLMAMYYSIFGLIALLSQFKWSVALPVFLSILVVFLNSRISMHKNYETAFDISAVTNKERVNQNMLDVANYFKEKDGVKSVCMYPDTLALDKTHGNRYVDMPMVLLGTDANSYITGCRNADTNEFEYVNSTHVIIWEYDDAIKKEIADEKIIFEQSFEDEYLKIDVYRVN